MFHVEHSKFYPRKFLGTRVCILCARGKGQTRVARLGVGCLKIGSPLAFGGSASDRSDSCRLRKHRTISSALRSLIGALAGQEAVLIRLNLAVDKLESGWRGSWLQHDLGNKCRLIPHLQVDNGATPARARRGTLSWSLSSPRMFCSVRFRPVPDASERLAIVRFRPVCS